MLLPHGYNVFTIDIQWYEPGTTGFDYRKNAPLVMFARDGLIGWCAEAPGSRDRYLALFNTRDCVGPQSGVPIGGALDALGRARARGRDLWSGVDIGPISRNWAPMIP